MSELDDKYFKKMVNALDNNDFEDGHFNCDKVLEELLTELEMFKTLKHYDKQIRYYA